MRVVNPKSLLLSLLLLCAVSFSLTAQDARKEYHESFPAGEGVTLASDVAYAQMEILSWEKDEVDVFAEVVVEASSQSRAEERLRKIEVNITKSGNTILVETDYDDGWSNNAKVKVNIVVKAPAYLNLNMEHKYGDLFLQEISGHVMLELKYGNIKAGRLTRGSAKPINSMELAYSNGTIEEAGSLELEIAYSDMEIDDSEYLLVESKYSKISGEKAGVISAEGAYDKYTFDDVGSFSAGLKYSGVKFENLRKSFHLDAQYTNVKLEHVSSGFNEIQCSLSYGNFNADVDSGASYKFEGEARYGSVNVAGEGRLSRNQEKESTRVWGTVGSNPKAEMSLVTRYGNINIE
ncbi:MAG: DUF4097 family beta strand repeat-containing protein [Bacteroidales bacterium]